MKLFVLLEVDMQQSQCFHCNALWACFFGSSTSDIRRIDRFSDVIRVAFYKVLGMFHIYLNHV